MKCYLNNVLVFALDVPMQDRDDPVVTSFVIKATAHSGTIGPSFANPGRWAHRVEASARPEEQALAETGGGATPPVVVGIDGSIGASAALHFAAEEAIHRGLPLRIVCAWEANAATYIGEAFASTADGLVEAERQAELIVRAALDRLASHTAIEIEALTIQGHPAKVLMDQAQAAALLVVGSCGRGAVAGLLNSSVSRKLTHHVSCPIVIVPTRD